LGAEAFPALAPPAFGGVLLPPPFLEAALWMPLVWLAVPASLLGVEPLAGWREEAALLDEDALGVAVRPPVLGALLAEGLAPEEGVLEALGLLLPVLVEGVLEALGLLLPVLVEEGPDLLGVLLPPDWLPLLFFLLLLFFFFFFFFAFSAGGSVRPGS